MADGFYQYGVRGMARGQIVWLNSGGSSMRCALIDATDYTVNLATHDFMDDVAAAAREEFVAMTLIDADLDGVLDANNITFVGTTGDACDALLIYDFNTNDADSVPFLYIDSATGLPVTLGGDVAVTWSDGANKIAKV